MTRPRALRRRPHLAAVPLVVAAVVASCGGDEGGAAPSDCTRIEGGRQTLVAEDVQWDIDCLRARQGETVTFTVELRDTSVDHNLNITGPSSGTMKTPLERGPGQQTLEATFDQAGVHRFVCDIHANMEGDLYVDEVAEGEDEGSGGG